MRRLLQAGFACALCLVAATPATAELVVLTTGRTLSVKAHRHEGGQTIMSLRSGGEVVCETSLILRIDPDEVPWPEPSPPPAVTVAPVPTVAVAGVPFDELIGTLSARHGVDAALIRAVVHTESGFQPDARSPKGAMGLMQLMPATARQYDVVDPYDPGANLAAGIQHLKALLARYDIRVALAAYNAGEATVRRHGGVPPFRETREYIERVLRRRSEYRRVIPVSGGIADIRPALAFPTS